MMVRINKVAILSCTKTKKQFPCKAEELYSASALFRKTLAYCKENYDKIFILSAKYHLIPLHIMIAPYEKTLKDMNSKDKLEWSEICFNNIMTEVDKFDIIDFHCGKEYYKHLYDWLKIKRYTVNIPITLPIGKKMQWYDNHMKKKPIKSKIKELPKHLKLAIAFEEELIKLRQEQIKGYKKRIQLMKKEISYGDACRQVKGIRGNLQFSWGWYSNLKEHYNKRHRGKNEKIQKYIP